MASYTPDKIKLIISKNEDTDLDYIVGPGGGKHRAPRKMWEELDKVTFVLKNTKKDDLERDGVVVTEKFYNKINRLAKSGKLGGEKLKELRGAMDNPGLKEKPKGSTKETIVKHVKPMKPQSVEEDVTVSSTSGKIKKALKLNEEGYGKRIYDLLNTLKQHLKSDFDIAFNIDEEGVVQIDEDKFNDMIGELEDMGFIDTTKDEIDIVEVTKYINDTMASSSSESEETENIGIMGPSEAQEVEKPSILQPESEVVSISEVSSLGELETISEVSNVMEPSENNTEPLVVQGEEEVLENVKADVDITVGNTNKTIGPVGTEEPPGPEDTQKDLNAADGITGDVNDRSKIVVKRYHPVSLLLFYGNKDIPNWDLDLQADILNLDISKSETIWYIDTLIKQFGGQIMVQKRKSQSLEEFNEICQMCFTVMRNMAIGNRYKTANVKVSDLLKIANGGAYVEEQPKVFVPKIKKPELVPGDIYVRKQIDDNIRYAPNVKKESMNYI